MGLGMALEELSLVLFTTIAPSGTVAVAIMAVAALAVRSDERLGRRVSQRIWVPLAIALVGLVASATHLGNPANALYVLLGVGSSPLSNEVATAVFFLGIAGVYWLLSFSERRLYALQTAMTGAIVVSAFVFVTAIAFAYRAETVLTWNTPFVPASLWLNALFGGPLLAMATLRHACALGVDGRVGKVLAGVSAVALAANVVVYLLQNGVLAHAENSLASGVQLVPCYPAMIAAFALLCAAGWVLVAHPSFTRRLPRLPLDAAGCVLVFAGIFIARFAFYMMHLTV